MLVALGWNNKRIAAALFVTQPTLRKHYFFLAAIVRGSYDGLDARLLSKSHAEKST